MKALEKAIKNVGNATKLAEQLGVWPMTVSHWIHRNKGIVPHSRVKEIYAITGVTPHGLRPDLYPNPTDGLPKSEVRE